MPTDFTYSSATAVTNGGFKQDYTEPFSTIDTKVLTIAEGQVKYAIMPFTIEQDMYLKFRSKVKLSEPLTFNYQVSNLDNSVAYYIKNHTALGNGKTEIIETVMFLAKGSYNLKMRLMTTPGVFVLGVTEIFELASMYDLESFDKGVHVLLGDSWLEIVGIYERLVERLPNATFLNFGVGGNDIDRITRRFIGTATDADIKNDPATYGDRKDATLLPVIDYTWVIDGTNDYNAGVTSAVFLPKMQDLMNYIIDRGAKPLIFTSSVGDIDTATNFTLSREYADIYYNLQYPTGAEEGTFVPTIAGTTTAGAHTYNIQEGVYRKINKTVTFALRVRMSVKDVAMDGSVQILGLPYGAAITTPVSLSNVVNVAFGTGLQLVAQVETNAKISITKLTSTSGVVADASDVANETMFYIAGTYPTA